MALRPVPPFVGRSHELEAMVAAFAGCRSERRGRGLVVHGDEGAGASRLARELQFELQRRGLAHHWWSGRCTRGAPLAYEPMAGLLRSVPGDTHRWLAEATAASGAGESSMVALLSGLAGRLRDAAADAPLVAFIDDVDGADPSTARLLAGVLALLDDAPVLFLAAGRSSAEHRAPAAFADHDEVAEVVVNPLDPDDAAALVRSIADELDEATVQSVVDASAGRPGIASALATASDAVGTSSSLLALLGPDAAVAVLASGLAGGWQSDAELAGRLALDPSVWATLVGRGILAPSERPAGGLIPVSDLWLDAARRSLGSAHRDVAARVAAQFGSEVPAATVAVAWEAADRPAEASAAWEAAADEAEAELAVATAAAALRRAVELGGDATLVRVGHRAGELSLAAGDRVEADAVAARLLPRLARHDLAGTIALHLMRYRARSEAGLPGADEHLDAAVAVDSPPCAPRVEALVVDSLRRVLDDPAGAARQAESAVAAAVELGDLAATASALGAAGLAAAIAGDLDAGLRRFDEALAAAARAGDSAAEARIASNRVYVLWRAGRPRDVERAAAAELERLAVRGISALGDQLAVGRAGALVCLARFDEAEAAIAAGRRMRMAADAATLLDLVEADLALLRGELDRAAALVERAGRSPARDVPEVAADLWLRRSELALARGDLVGAAERARTGLDASGGADAIALARLGLAWWRAGGPRTAVAVELPALQPVGAELAALLATIAAHGERSAPRWAAAAAAWDAVPSPVEAWRCRLGAAIDRGDADELDALADEARARGAHGAAAEAEAAWRAAGGRRRPRRSAGVLTERELEVLSCVARGSTNREVGEQLFISTRTVGAHLERCMAKLGVSTRGAAVHEARRQGLITS